MIEMKKINILILRRQINIEIIKGYTNVLNVHNVNVNNYFFKLNIYLLNKRDQSSRI